MGGVAILVFSDLVDSTALLATLGDDRMETVRRAHMADVASAVEAGGGRVVKTLGDGAMACFESALGALQASARIQDAVERLDSSHGGIGIAARVGVAAGEPIAADGDLHGMSVVIASRLSSAAGAGEVLVQDLVHGLVASRDGVALEAGRDYTLKGVPSPVRASTLLWRQLVAEAEKGVEGAAGVEAGPDLELPRVLASYAAEPLIGRDREIAKLTESTAPRAGRRAVLILGEPGIGKTRHAAAAATEARARGAVVVLARCPPEAVVPFEPWVRAIGELARGGDEEWREALAGAAGPELASLVPELSRYSGVMEQAGASEMVAAEGARYRLLRGIGSTLLRATGGAPLHVVLDDAHWCDPASAQALAHLLEDADVPLVLVVTARDREMGRRHPVSRVLFDLRRTGDLDELCLEGLDADGMAALVDAKVGRGITPGLAAKLQARTAGNPFFAGELVRDLDGRGALAEGEALDSAPAPDAIADLVEERLARLDPDTERFLAAVAAIGPSAPVALAAEAVGLSPAEAERAVAQGLAESLVDEVAAMRPTIAFPHALVREALVAGTGEAARARLHLAIARALEGDTDAEPAELARHYGLAVELAGPGPAIAAYRAAATAAAAGHDHEQAAAHIHSALSLLPESEVAERAMALLELGEQELLAADLIRARRSFGAAIEAARAIGDAVTLSRAALGFAGDDVGFGFEAGTDDPVTAEQLREGLAALGDAEPRLALRMVFRLVYLEFFTEDHAAMQALGRRATALSERIGDAEARLLAKSTHVLVRLARDTLPPDVRRFQEDIQEMLALAEEGDREDLLFRVCQWLAAVEYVMGRIPQCEEAAERAAEIAARLGTPRFAWEIDLNRCMRLMDRGERERAEAHLRQAGAVVCRLRPDMHIVVELAQLLLGEWYYDGDATSNHIVYDAMMKVAPRGLVLAAAAAGNASSGDVEIARSQIWRLLGDSDDLESLRRPDVHMPLTVCLLALAASLVGDREAGARLRKLLEPLRGWVAAAVPSLSFGQLPEWHIGRLELLLGRSDAAVEELSAALRRLDEMEMVWASAWARVDLATALHRRGRAPDAAEAESLLAEAEELAARYGVALVAKHAADARAELRGEAPASSRFPGEGRTRPMRALASRGGQRALAAMARRLDDAELERRFLEPRRQRSLVRAMARGFQPAHAAGFSGVVAYELEPLAIEPPPDSPWRWAIEVDSRRGKARVLEPAPLVTAVTVHLGLADWVRVAAGIEDPLAAMVAGRGSVEGDVRLSVRLQAMFGAG